ncbi:MAG: phage regulatory protein/antirepressor Ant, partial [Pseudomonadota bacterium]
MKELVKVIDGKPMADSLTVAEVFGKRHDDVMRAVRNMDCSSEFRDRNFAGSTYRPENGRRDYPLYNMTRDGFTFLVMGFTGAKAAQWKEAYIDAFNKLEKRSGKLDLNDPSQLRAALLDYSDRVIALEADLSEAKPKVAALDRIATADKSLCITDAAKHLQMRPKDLFHWLKMNKWIYRRAG